MQLLRVVSLVALALSSCLSRCYATLAAFASPLIAIFTALLRRSGYFSLVSWLGSGYGTLVAPYAASILLALPAGLFSILIPVRAAVHKPSLQVTCRTCASHAILAVHALYPCFTRRPCNLHVILAVHMVYLRFMCRPCC